jgi:hypothetical protein
VCFLSGRHAASTTSLRPAPNRLSTMLVSAFAISSSDATFYQNSQGAIVGNLESGERHYNSVEAADQKLAHNPHASVQESAVSLVYAGAAVQLGSANRGHLMVTACTGHRRAVSFETAVHD